MIKATKTQRYIKRQQKNKPQYANNLMINTAMNSQTTILSNYQNYKPNTHFFCSTNEENFPLTKNEFLDKWESFKTDVVNKVEDIDPKNLDDLEEVVEAVKIVFTGRKTIVLSRMTPRREIWLSSPLSGPTHFSYCPKDDKWYSPSRRRRELQEVLWEDQNMLMIQ